MQSCRKNSRLHSREQAGPGGSLQEISRSPDQASQRSPEQTSQRSPEQTSQRSQQGTPEPTQHNTPVNTPYNTPEPEPEQNTCDESSIANNDVWKVGIVHTDGRVRIEVIEGIWIEDWKNPECRAKYERKKQNRRGGVDQGSYPPTNTGGSASSRTVAARLAGEWERDPSALDLFEYLHTKKHDRVTYIDEKSAKIAEKIKTLRAERSKPTDGSSLPQPVDENKLYYDAVGGRNKRNMVYGIGSTQNIFYEPSSSNISKFTSP
ncbi:hypothetical protein POM88_039722 [Heracleum sosnowskyi]|uniref:Uncharacterized protein n=1 Tax=Heracleum sosnowskyi TaxID=360622 RepID=A0AAD8HBW0_9APIA|nr:hypothetical protein POM88_039722 [Heracleum sosnowskyi]